MSEPSARPASSQHSSQQTTRVGVALVPPRGRAGWRLIWRVPGSTKRHSRTLTPDEARTAKTRRAAQRAQAELQLHAKIDRKRTARALVDGSLTVRAAMARALDRPLNRGTRIVYERVAALFVQHHGEVMVRDLSRSHLQDFAVSRMKVPSERNGNPRSAHTVNKELRSLASLLNNLRRGGMLKLSREEIGDALRNQRADVKLKPYLPADAVRVLLRFAQEYDRQNTTRKPMAPLLRAAVLTGMRIEELAKLRWEDCHSTHIEVSETVAKGGRARRVELDVSPTALPTRPENASGLVFGFTLGSINAARKRLIRAGAPRFTFHMLRRTCGSYLSCAPAIYGASAAFMSARRLGHSVAIAERHYVGVVKGIPATCTTLEQALGLEDAGLDIAAVSAQRALSELVERVGEWMGTDFADQLRGVLAKLPPPTPKG